MATIENQQSIDKDCSQGFCNIYCLQWCHFLFSSPPPLSLSGAEDTAFSPLIIAVIAILSSALLLVIYYTFSNNCASLFFTRQPIQLYDSPAKGIQEAIINKIAVLRYKREDVIVDGTDCLICLGEFKEEESLRLLPKCSHAFHVHCIDTWLNSHSNCPLCRVNIMLPSPGFEGGDGVVIFVRDLERIGDEGKEMEKRLVSRWGRGGRGKRVRGGRSRGGLHAVMSPVRMKRSVSNGRSLFARQGRGRIWLLPDCGRGV